MSFIDARAKVNVVENYFVCLFEREREREREHSIVLCNYIATKSVKHNTLL